MKIRDLIGTKELYKKILSIAIPVMIQNLITNFVALIDNIMVGQVGTEQMSGVAIVNQIFLVFNLAVFGAVSGAGIFCAQFFGRGDHEGVRHTFRFKVISAIFITLIGTLVFMCAGDGLIMSYLHDAEKGIDLMATFESAKSYMMVMLAGNLAFALEQAYSSTLRESGNTTLPMIAGIVAVATNTFLNFMLIFGIGFFPKMGVVGAALATVVSRYVQIIIVISWTHFNRNKLIFPKGLYRSLKIPFNLAKRIFIKGFIPLVINETLWAAGIATLTQCYSLRGIDVVAGLNISTTVVNLFNVMFIAIGSGIAVIIGHMLGAEKFQEAKENAPKLIAFSTMLCVGLGIVMALLSPLFPMAYNTSEHVKKLATVFIIISAIFMPVHGMCHATYFTIRSGGKTLLTFLFDSCCTWVVIVPLAYCLAYFTKLDIFVVYFLCQAIEIVKCIIGAIFIKKDIWISNITNEM